MAAWACLPARKADSGLESLAGMQMLEAVERSVLYGLALLAGMIVGGVAAAWWQPSRRVRNYIQHLAAGVVFAAVGVEVLPDVMHRDNPVAVVVGFALGTVSMLVIRAMSRRAESGDTRADVIPWAFLAAVAVDVFVDGMLIGVGFSVGEREGVLIALAMTGCSLSLGLATSATLMQAGQPRLTATGFTAGIGVLPVLGAVAGALLASQLTGASMEALLSFTCAALLYLVTEELLVEAHEDQEVPESALTTAMFFVGFLALLIVDMSIG